jgi:DNA-binding transcriptional LysR family regulator
MTKVDLNRVATFVRVVEIGTFTGAARRLGVPVSSVSRAVGNLENELGVRLLHRTTRKLHLTDGGRLFFQRMETVVAEAEEATRAVIGLASEPRGLVRITAVPGIAGQELPQIIAKLVRRYPEVTIELTLTNRLVDLVGEGFDLAIRNGVLEDSSLVARKVADGELGIFAAPTYLKRHGRPRSPSQLAGRDCLVYGSRGSKLPWRLRGPRGQKIAVVSGPIICDDMIFLREAALEGVGLALLPVEITTAAVEEGRLVRVLPRFGVVGGGRYVVWPSQKLVPARVIAVREMLIEELAHL